MAPNPTSQPSTSADRSTEIGTNLEYLGETDVKLGTVSYTWVIRNFDYCSNNVGDMTRSPKFPDEADSRKQWYMVINPNGCNKKCEGFVSLHLYRVLNDIPSIKASFKISIVNSEKEKVHTHPSESMKIFTNLQPAWGYNTFIKKDLLLLDAKNLMPNKILTIFCEITLVENIVHTSTKLNERPFLLPEFNLADDFKQLLANNRYSDFTISVAHKEFRVNKSILACRSPVFAAMFDSGVKQEFVNRLEIRDVDYVVMEEVLRFVYTCKVKNIENIADRLLAAADKYALEDLKLMCEESLQAPIAVNNAVDTLILADLHSAKLLKAKAIDFICKHCKLVQTTAGYKRLIESHPYLLAELFEAVSMKVDNNADGGTPAKQARST